MPFVIFLSHSSGLHDTYNKVNALEQKRFNLKPDHGLHERILQILGTADSLLRILSANTFKISLATIL